MLTTGFTSQAGLTTEGIEELAHCAQFVLFSGRLYKLGPEGVLRICPNPDQYKDILEYMHISVGGFHVSSKETVKRVLLDGYWWPTLRDDAEDYVRKCRVCSLSTPIAYATLFHISPIPKWSSYLENYLTHGHTDEKLPAHRKKAIEVEASNYQLIEGQLYKRGKDGNLRTCVCESDYLSVLTNAHAGIGGGHFSGETTAKIILWSGLWWPTVFHDATEYVKQCDECQRTKPPITSDNMPLRPIMTARAFAKWGSDL